MSHQFITITTPCGTRTVGVGQPCFIVAEMSANHKQEYHRAEEIIRAASAAGADAIKLQTYTPESMTIDCEEAWFRVDGKDNPDAWKGQTLYQLYEKAYTPREWHPKLKMLAERLGLFFFSTPFSSDDVDFLETLGVGLYKVASYEATDIPLLKRIAATGKPVVMSVGFSTREEIQLSVDTLQSGGTRELALLHCVTTYGDHPTLHASNLRTMADMEERFGTVVGFSDNTAGIDVPVLAAAMGASIIEKHLTIDHGDGSLDERFSLDAKEFGMMTDAIRTHENIAGVVRYGPQTPTEEYNRRFRRSLFVVKDMKRGESFSPENIRSIRPAEGLPTRYYDDVIGKTASEDIRRGTPLQRHHIA